MASSQGEVRASKREIESAFGGNRSGGFQFGRIISVDSIALVCLAGFVFLSASGIVLNALIYSRVAEYFGPAREIATLAGGLTYLAALLIARFRPSWLYVGHTSAATILLSVVAAPLLIYALQTCSPVATVVALCVRAVARAWAMTLMVAALVRVRSLKSVTLIVTAGLLIANLCRPIVLMANTSEAAAIALYAIGIVPIILLTSAAHPVLDQVRTGAPAEVMELLHPGAFLKPSHAMFMCVLMYSAASGYAMTFGEVGNAPVETEFFAYVLMLLVVYVFVVKGTRQEDRLFSFSVVLVMAGFLMVPLTFDTESIAANSLMDIGECCFDALLWLMFASIGKRSLFAMLPTFGLAEFCSSIGTNIGAVLGHASNALVHGDARMVVSFALILAFVFFVVLWLGFRTFSFTKVINDVEVVHEQSDGFVTDVRDVCASDGRYRAEDSAHRDSAASASGEDALGDFDRADAFGFAPPSRIVSAEGGGFARVNESSACSAESSTDRFSQNCRRIAEESGLTEREREIFAMLARGRNARFIMEEFVLSRNTVKSHIKHIYAKLGVHSQQELIDLVENAS